MDDQAYDELLHRQDNLDAKVDDLQKEVTVAQTDIDRLEKRLDNIQSDVKAGFDHLGREVATIGANVNQVLAEKSKWGEWARSNLPVMGKWIFWFIASVVLIGYGVNNLPDIVKALMQIFAK